MKKVPATFKIDPRSKRRVDLMALAASVNKSAIIDEAVTLLAHRYTYQAEQYVKGVRLLINGGRPAALSPEEKLLGRRRKKRPSPDSPSKLRGTSE